MTANDISFLQDIKEHYELGDFEEAMEGLPINGHFLFLLPVDADNGPMMILATSVCPINSREECEAVLRRTAQLQTSGKLDAHYAIGLDAEETLLSLQTIIHPENGKDAIDAIDAFTRQADRLEQFLNSAEECME